ncbi:MAG: serine hydrolase [Nodosilinea sp.]
MSQYDDSRNPFSASSDRGETVPGGAGSPWGESAPEPGHGGLQLPGEAENAWRAELFQRPSPTARRRNEWRQHQQLTPDFGVAPAEPEPQPAAPPPLRSEGRPAARNAALPTFKRGLAPPPQRPARATESELPLAQPQPPSPRSPQPSAMPLQMHPHSTQIGNSAPSALGRPSTEALPPNVTPLRPLPRRPAPGGQGPSGPWSKSAPSAGRLATAADAQINSSAETFRGNPPEKNAPARRSRAAAARKKLANPPLPLLYLIRLVILGVGVAAIAGTLLSVLSPSNVASTRDGESVSARDAAPLGAAGALIQGTAATAITDLRLTSEIARLRGELEQLSTLTPGLTPVAFAIDLDSGQYVDLGGAEPVAAASTIKVPILIAFLQQVDAGTMALNQSLVLQEDYMAGGSGNMRGEAVGTEYTALDIATRMIVVSDNTATNMMIAALGGIEALNQTFDDWGLEHTLLRNPLPDLEGTNITSAKDLALIMALIDQGGLLTPRSRDRLFSIMQRTQNDSLIPSGIRDQSLTANKTGDIGGMLGDMALVDVPNGKRYGLAVLVQRPSNDGRASELIRRMTETIHAEMAQPIAPVGNPNATSAPLSPPGEFENPSSGEFGDPSAPAPVDRTSPDRAPARDEIPPG